MTINHQYSVSRVFSAARVFVISKSDCFELILKLILLPVIVILYRLYWLLYCFANLASSLLRTIDIVHSNLYSMYLFRMSLSVCIVKAHVKIATL